MYPPPPNPIIAAASTDAGYQCDDDRRRHTAHGPAPEPPGDVASGSSTSIAGRKLPGTGSLRYDSMIVCRKFRQHNFNFTSRATRGVGFLDGRGGDITFGTPGCGLEFVETKMENRYNVVTDTNTPVRNISQRQHVAGGALHGRPARLPVAMG
eukprot:454758-Rhodomonas_salina.1